MSNDVETQGNFEVSRIDSEDQLRACIQEHENVKNVLKEANVKLGEMRKHIKSLEFEIEKFMHENEISKVTLSDVGFEVTRYEKKKAKTPNADTIMRAATQFLNNPEAGQQFTASLYNQLEEEAVTSTYIKIAPQAKRQRFQEVGGQALEL